MAGQSRLGNSPFRKEGEPVLHPTVHMDSNKLIYATRPLRNYNEARFRGGTFITVDGEFTAYLRML